MRRTLGLIISLGLVLCALPHRPAAASFHEHLTAVWAAEIEGPTWLALVIEVRPAAEQSIDLALSLDEARTEGEWVFAAKHVSGEGLDSSSFSGVGCRGLGPSVRVQVGDRLPVVDHSGGHGCGGSAGIRSGLGLAAGRYEVVYIVGSDGDFSGSLDVRVAENVDVVGVTSGPAFDAADGDFAGLANGQARAGIVEGQAVLDGSVAQTIGSSLYGWFLSHGHTQLRTDGPHGSERSWGVAGNGTIYEGKPPGDYTFTVEAKADVQAIFWTRVWLLVADVTLPA